MSWHDLFPLLAIVLSVIALSVSLRDWKSKLLLKARKGSTYNPYRLKKATNGLMAFPGAVELYNRSSRLTRSAITAFWRKDESGHGSRWKARTIKNLLRIELTVIKHQFLGSLFDQGSGFHEDASTAIRAEGSNWLTGLVRKSISN
jgi:hypothetical protein